MKKYVARTYIVAELILLLLNIIFFLLIVLGNLGGGHRFSVGELFLPALIIIAFSIIPLRLASRAESEGRTVESSDQTSA